MIIGFFDESGHPKIEIGVIGEREDVAITPTIDTGFDGQLCLPVEIAIQLGLELVSRVPVELANGSRQKTLVFSGTIEMGNQEVEAEIILTESDDAHIEDAMERLWLLHKVEKGCQQADAGQTVSHEEAKSQLKKWLD